MAAKLGRVSEDGTVSVYARLGEIPSLKVSRAKHRLNAFHSVVDVWRVASRLPEWLEQLVRFHALHGFNFKEMVIDGFTVKGDALVIHGQKTDHRNNRVVPLMMTPPEIPQLQYNRYWRWLRAASKAEGIEQIKTHDLRRAYQRWMRAAGVPHEVVQQFAGHKPQTQTDEYLYHEPSAELLKGYKDLFQRYLDKQLKDKQLRYHLAKVADPKNSELLTGEKRTFLDELEAAKLKKVRGAKSPVAPKVIVAD